MTKTIKGNFSKVAQSDGKFPLDADTFENLQNNTTIISALGAALGKVCVILSGCSVSGNRRGEGYVYVKLSEPDTGEILYYPGGNSNEPNCYVKAEPMDVTAMGEPFAGAYTVRTLANGLPSNGETKLLWGDFKIGSEIFAQKSHTHKISEVNELQTELDNKEEKIAALQKAVQAPAVTFIKGMIMMWGGAIKDIPQGWHLCDGTGGTVNLKDRFVVGAGGSYAVGATGGSDSVTLTSAQMPSHTHSIKSCSSSGKHWHYVYNDSGAHRCDSSNNFWCAGHEASNIVNPPESSINDTSRKFGHTDQDGAHTHTIVLNNTGSGQSHENRPPYYALAYIQYIGA